MTSKTNISQDKSDVNSNDTQNGENNAIKNSSRDDEYLELTKEPEKNMGLNQISVDIIFKE